MNSYGNLAYDRTSYEYDTSEYEGRYGNNSNARDKKDFRREYRENDLEHKSRTVSKRVNTVKKKKNVSAKKNNKAGSKSMKKRRLNEHTKTMLRRAIYIAMITVSAIFMITRYVVVNDGREQIAVLEKSLTNEEAKTSQKSYELEKSVDLSEIEKEATTRLGMQRPEKYQTIYINVPTDDVTHKTSDSVEGVGNTLKAFFKKIGSDIIDYFSIK